VGCEEPHPEAFLKYKTKAKNLVRTYVTLVVEEQTEAKMAKVLADTPAGKMRGELKDFRPEGREPTVLPLLQVRLVLHAFVNDYGSLAAVLPANVGADEADADGAAFLSSQIVFSCVSAC
jgi:hypothetical protein